MRLQQCGNDLMPGIEFGKQLFQSGDDGERRRRRRRRRKRRTMMMMMTLMLRVMTLMQSTLPHQSQFCQWSYVVAPPPYPFHFVPHP